MVAELENRFKNNEQRIQRQRVVLDQLKENATMVRDEIREQVQKYSSCLWGCYSSLFTVCCCSPQQRMMPYLRQKTTSPMKIQHCSGTTIFSLIIDTLPVKCYISEMPSSVHVLYHIFDSITIMCGVYVFKLLQQVDDLRRVLFHCIGFDNWFHK